MHKTISKNIYRLTIYLMSLCLLISTSILGAFADNLSPGQSNTESQSTKSIKQTTSAEKKTVKDLEKIKPLTDDQLHKYQYCGKDNDCVVANNGCCDCANGSPVVSINRDRVKDFRKRFSCNNISCGKEYAGTACDTGYVACVSHKCRYVTTLQFEIFGGNLERE